MRLIRLTGLALALTVAGTAPAFADASVFVGKSTNPSTRTVKGLAIGVGLLIVGFEFEYADTAEDLEAGAPALRTGMGNVLFQTPFAIGGLQFYGTMGGGAFREELGTLQETQLAINTGAGVKVSLLGPIRARLDYRVFKLRGEPLYPTVHRVYAGINLKF